MKKFTLLLTAGMFACSFNGFSQIKVNSTGQVGINNATPTYQLDVAGTFRINDSGDILLYQYGTFYSPSGYALLGDDSYMWDEVHASRAYFNYNPTILSDINAKTDIRDLQDINSKLLLLRPVTYKLKPKFKGDEKADAKIAEIAKSDQLGLIAQEVREVFPGIVTEQADGTLGIRYTELIPVLVKAFQEQQTEIDELKARIEQLETAGK